MSYLHILACPYHNYLFKWLSAGKDTFCVSIFCGQAFFTIWQRSLFYKVTITELERTYERIGVRFDEYHGESMYGKDESEKVIQILQEKSVLQTDFDGKKFVSFIPKEGQEERKVSIQKSDGSSLYLTRDCAAAMHRDRKYNFERMIYVVENGQTDHFVNLFNTLRLMGESFHEKMEHVKFGRIEGMSSRKGTAVFLSDILDEAAERMSEQRSRSPNTRSTSVHANEILGVTAVLVNDMKQRRQKDYKFSWEKVLQTTGDSGVKIQYTHARLTSLLEANSDLKMGQNVDLLREDEALAVIYHLGKFDEVVRDSYVEMEPCHIVQFMFRLCNDTSKAIKMLPVKKADSDELASQRLRLFMAARATLRKAMKILGIKPLHEM